MHAPEAALGRDHRFDGLGYSPFHWFNTGTRHGGKFTRNAPLVYPPDTYDNESLTRTFVARASTLPSRLGWPGPMDMATATLLLPFSFLLPITSQTRCLPSEWTLKHIKPRQATKRILVGNSTGTMGTAHTLCTHAAVASAQNTASCAPGAPRQNTVARRTKQAHPH